METAWRAGRAAAPDNKPMPPDPVTDWLPRVPASPPRHAAPPPVPAAVTRVLVRVSAVLWAVSLPAWAWALVLAYRALWGAG